MKNCRFSIFFEKPALEQSLVKFLLFWKICEFLFIFTQASVGGSWLAVENSVGITIDSRFSGAPGLVVPFESLAYSTHRSATAPSTLSWLTEITVRRINSMVLSVPLKWMDFIPLPFLFNSPLSKALDARNFGCPLSVKIDHHILSNVVPFSIWFAYVSSVPFLFRSRPPKMTNVLAWIFEHIQSLCEHSQYNFLLFPRFLHSMS